MKVYSLMLGSYQTNCYLAADDDGVCAVIDPGYTPERVLEAAQRYGLTIRAVLLTHGHFDHVGGVRGVAEAARCPVWLCEADTVLPERLTAGPLYYTDTYADGDTVEVGSLRFTVLETPGHTPGSVCLLCENVLFSGDTLFAGSCGRVDLAGGVPAQMGASLKRLAELPGNYAARPRPGHDTGCRARGQSLSAGGDGMKLLLRGHDDRYAVEQLQLALFPEEPMEPVTEPFSGDGAVSSLHTGAVWLTATAEITLHGKTGRACRRLRTAEADVPARRRLLQNTYYEAAMCLREPPAWGSLSGVRPTKLTTRALLEGRTPTEAEKLLRTRYHVSPERSRLCVEASEATVQAAQLLRPQDVSVYVGIPFCPTRCAYCSFVSSSIERFSGLLEPYLDALVREIAHTGDLLRASGRTVRTLYIGGGTPTTLSAAQLRRLMEALRTHIDLTELVEYTVEGGRPDTLDAEKLETIASMGCGRMSINPQTMNDAVLARVGRRHTATQTAAAYEAARAAGYDAVNMDLIAGLPGDDPASFADSLRQVLALAPENVTVHTLALKKGADLYAGRMELPSADDVAQMLAGAEASLRAAGYTPYYLYRQKYMSGSFENIGWCRPGTAGLYNIYMMEEMHSIVSLGGGAMTKINLPDGRLERFHNPKFPQQYLERIDDVLAQKDAAFRLL